MAQCRKGRHRSDLEICASILSTVVGGPMRKTWIMNGVNLNYALVTKHLGRLVDSGFLSCERGDGQYELTDSGRDFLEQYERFRLVAGRILQAPE